MQAPWLRIRFFTVATALLPERIAVGERFTVEVPSVSLPLTSHVENFTVISQSDFVRVIHVTGSIVIPDSVVVHSGGPASARPRLLNDDRFARRRRASPPLFGSV